MSQIPPSSGGDKPEDPDHPAAASPGEEPESHGEAPSPYGGQAPPPGYGEPPPYPYGQPPPPYAYGQAPPPGAYGQAPPPGAYGQPGYGIPPYGQGYGPPGQTPYGWSGGPGYGPYEYPSTGPGALASYGSRVVAYIIDALIVGIPIGIITVAGSLGRFGEYSLEAVAAFVYATLMMGGSSAQTIGMRVMKIGVADASSRTSPVGYGKAAARTAVALAFNLIIFIGPLLDLLWPLWDRMNQTLHDKAAGTIVVRR